MSIYSDMAVTALRLLTQYGRSQEFSRTLQGSYDPVTGSVSSSSESYNATCYRSRYSIFEMQNSAIHVGDIKLLAATGDYQVGDTAEIDGATYQVLNITPIGDTPVAYYLQMRR